MNSCDVSVGSPRESACAAHCPTSRGWHANSAPPDLRSCTPSDVLLASTVPGKIGRVLLAPVTSWSGATFTSIMPLRFKGGMWWVRARLVSDIGTPGLSVDTMRDQIDSGEVEFDIEQAAGAGGFLPLARLTLRHVDPSNDDIAFDPTVHSHP
jgi:hypothetical protein